MGSVVACRIRPPSLMWQTRLVLVEAKREEGTFFFSLLSDCNFFFRLPATSSLHTDCQCLCVEAPKCWISHGIQIPFRRKTWVRCSSTPLISSSSRYTPLHLLLRILLSLTFVRSGTSKITLHCHLIYRRSLRTGCSTLTSL